MIIYFAQLLLLLLKATLYMAKQSHLTKQSTVELVVYEWTTFSKQLYVFTRVYTFPLFFIRTANFRLLILFSQLHLLFII